MAIVEDKRGMQIGNMPSVDAVSQEGFIIYSDDGIHTYKMTIAEFAQAIGVVMTGGGDGDGEGEGLAYWIEDARRIYRDLMSSNENEFRTIIPVVGSSIQFKVFGNAVAVPYWAFTNDGVHFTASHGFTNVLPKYGNYTVTQPVQKDILKTFRYPALNELLEQPDSKYYCNYVGSNAATMNPYVSIPTEVTLSAFGGTINPNYTWQETTYDKSVDPPESYEYETFKVPRIDAPGQDRVYFGTIHLNVNRNVVLKNYPVDYSRGGKIGEISVPVSEGTSAYEALDAEIEHLFSTYDYKMEPLIPPKNNGTEEFVFALYCLGCPSEKVKSLYSKGNDSVEFEYLPWYLSHAALSETNYVKYRVPYYNGATPDLPTSLDLSALAEKPQYNLPCDKNVLHIVDYDDGHYTRSPYLLDCLSRDDSVSPDGSVTYYDKSDIGAAYFEDEEGTMWYVLLFPKMGNATNFDKAPSYLDLGKSFDHWCYNGTYGDVDVDGLTESEHYRLHDTGWDGDPWQDGDNWKRIYGHHRYFIKDWVLEDFTENIRDIGKAIVNALGLHGIKPLELEASGIHSEISATPDTALNGGRYLNSGQYERTYNLDAVTGSLYLKGDVYDNGKKASDKFQEKLTPGENISIERDENEDLVISSTGGGGSGSTATFEYDSENKRLSIKGLADKDIDIAKSNGIYFTGQYQKKTSGGTGWDTITLNPNIEFGSLESTIEGSQSTGVNSKLYLDIKETYRNNTQRRLTGGKHVWLNSQPSTDGNAPSGSGTTSVRDTLYTDCIDTIKVDGVALTTQLDAQTGSHFVDIPSSGGGAASNPFTYKNYYNSEYVSSDYSAFTSLGTFALKGTLNYDGYSHIHVEVAFPVEASDTIAAGSLFTVEIRPAGFAANADIVEDIVEGSTYFEDSCCFLTDTKPVMHSTSGRVWNVITIDGVINYKYSVDRTFTVNVKHDSGIRPLIRYNAGITFVPKSS